MKKLIAIILAALYLFIYLGEEKKSPATEKIDAVINGVCVHVYDGDTVKINSDNKIYKVRLKGIDAPEKNQPYGTEAQQQLMQLCHKKNVEVYAYGKDKYGRILGKVMVDGVDVNAQMIRLGAAWHYNYSKDSKLTELERNARLERLGLWKATAKPVPPWQHRKSKREIADEKQ